MRASMLAIPTAMATPSQREFRGGPASATFLRASRQAAAQATRYSPAVARVESTASSSKLPVNARMMASAA